MEARCTQHQETSTQGRRTSDSGMTAASSGRSREQGSGTECRSRAGAERSCSSTTTPREQISRMASRALRSK
eukprot:1323210-Heterocapsa_arctica.AAC.1